MKRNILLIVFIGLSVALFAKDTTMWVAISNAKVKSSTGFFAKVNGTLDYATQVTQTKTNGGWSYITCGNIQGWITTSSLSKRKIVASGSNFSADADELALAGKGFNSEIESEYRKSGNVNYDAVDAMEKISISEDELLKFITEGKLKGAE